MVKFKKITLFVLFIFSVHINGQAQVNQRSQIKVSLSPVVYNNSYTYDIHLSTSYRFSGLFNTLYYKPLGRGFGLNAGVGFGILPNIDYTIISYPTQTPPELIESYYSNGSFKDETPVDWLFTMPVTLQKTFKSNCSSTNFAIEFGFQYNRLMTSAKSDWSFEDGYYVDGVSHEEVSFNYEIEANNPPHQFGFLLKLGIVNTLKNNNTFNINLVGHLADYRSVTSGTYEFSNLGRGSSGWVSQQVEYLGIEFSYGISSFKKKDKR